jgi:rubrerythrin
MEMEKRVLYTGEGLTSQGVALWMDNYAMIASKFQRPRLAQLFEGFSQELRDGDKETTGVIPVEDNQNNNLADLEKLIRDCIDTSYPALKGAAKDNRGALRAFTWGSKVATILKSILGRLKTQGDGILKEGQAFFVCEGCGFMYIGERAPEICPVCKAPASRFARY